MTPKRLTTLAAVCGIASAVAFGIGIILLGAGLTLSSVRGSLFTRGGPEKPGYVDGHPVGLYLMTRFWVATGSLEKAVWYFTSDGRAYVDLEDGFTEERLAAHKGRHGTVSIDGDEMTVTWSDGRKTTGTVERGNGGFNWDGGIFAAVKPFEDSSPLVGRWEGGSSSTLGGTSASASRTLELKEDGTFTGATAASLRSESSESVASTGSTGRNAGKWKLEGYSLVLTYDDGSEARGITFPYDDEKTPVNPDRFYFAGTMYRRL
jgi:hypothetical protein